MTVCLAAYSPVHKVIVSLSDTMLSNTGLSAEGAGFKSAPLNRAGSWMVLYSGLPEEFAALTRRTRAALSATEAASLDDVLAAVSDAYRAEQVRIGDTYFLAPLGLTRETFFSKRNLIGEAAFARIWESLAGVKLSTELLICGFDGEGGHIISTTSEGLYQIHDSACFHAIGEGAWLALGTLTMRPLFVFETVPNIVYTMCCAKFAAERARSVGTATIVMTNSANGDFAFLYENDLAAVRAEWTEATRPLKPSPGTFFAVAERLANTNAKGRHPHHAVATPTAHEVDLESE